MELGGVRLKDGDYIFGFPDEWAKFQERFPDFLKAFDVLAETMNKSASAPSHQQTTR